MTDKNFLKCMCISEIECNLLKIRTLLRIQFSHIETIFRSMVSQGYKGFRYGEQFRFLCQYLHNYSGNDFLQILLSHQSQFPE